MKLSTISTWKILIAATLPLTPWTGHGLEGNTWIKKADMPTARQVQTCAVNGKIYAMGGVTIGNGTALDTVEEYDPATDTWATKANLPTARHLFACAEVNGKLYAIGGNQIFLSNPLNTVEEYDPKTDTWIPKTDMPTARGALSSVAVQGRIYVLGGRNCCTAFATMEEYDPATDRWTKRADMRSSTTGSSIRKICFGASEVNGRIFAIGGSADHIDTRGVSMVLEYTLPVFAPWLQSEFRKDAGKSMLRLAWPSRSDCLDLLQSNSQLHTEGWTDVETFSGNGSVLVKEIPTSESAAFYRLRQALR